MKQLSILLVEDNEALSSIYTLILESAGYVVMTATNGDVALAILESSNNYKFDAILTDHRTNGMSGLELVTHIRHKPYGKFLPIVAMSAYDSPTIIRDFLVAGADRFLLKPVSRKDLVSEIEQAIEQTHALQERLVAQH